MDSIFDKLDILLGRAPQRVNESEDVVDDELTFDEGFETEDEGVISAAKQIWDRLFGGGEEKGAAPAEKRDMEEDKSALPSETKSKDKGGDDKTFKSSKLEGMDDLEKFDDEGSGDGMPPLELGDEDFEFDDFDYDDNQDGGGSGKRSSKSKSDEPGSSEESDKSSGGAGGDTDEEDDGDWDDMSDMGDMGDYDFGEDDSGEDGEGDDSDGDEFGKKSSSKKGSKSSKSGEKGDSSDTGDYDYDDILDYETDEDSLEAEIKDALDRAEKGASTKSTRDKLKSMKDLFGDDGEESGDDGEKSKDGKSGEKSGSSKRDSGDGEEGEEGDKSDDLSFDKSEELSKQIKDALDESSKTGSGELPGETLDKVPDSKSMEADMREAGFDEKDIRDMKSAKDHDPSGEIDEEKITKDAMRELDAKAEKKSNGEKRTSSLSRLIMRSVLGEKITDMEWKSMLKVFLESKSKLSSSGVARGRSTSWGDKKHLWRDAILPKTSVASSDIEEITCFIDFSGSVEEHLVKVFINRVLDLCNRLSFSKVKVYGFAEELSEPFEIKKRDIAKDENGMISYIDEMWEFIRNQNIGWGYENFEVVAKEILKVKRKDHNAPILIFGDGLWGVSYPNPRPPIYLKDLCSRYLKDILTLVYFEEGKKWLEEILSSEFSYLKDMVGLKNVITTSVKNLKE